jgi:hypothetical protein
MRNFALLPSASLYFNNTQSHSFYNTPLYFLQYASHKTKMLVSKTNGLEL